MIAVAKGLLVGLETAVATASKKDGTAKPPFSETYQQVSADLTGRVGRTLPQRLAKADRTSQGGKKGGAVALAGSSSVVGAALNTSKGTSGAKTAGDVLDPMADVVDGSAEEVGNQDSLVDAKLAAISRAPEAGNPVTAEAPVVVAETEAAAYTGLPHFADAKAGGLDQQIIIAAERLSDVFARNSVSENEELVALPVQQKDAVGSLGVVGSAIMSIAIESRKSRGEGTAVSTPGVTPLQSSPTTDVAAEGVLAEVSAIVPVGPIPVSVATGHPGGDLAGEVLAREAGIKAAPVIGDGAAFPSSFHNIPLQGASGSPHATSEAKTTNTTVETASIKSAKHKVDDGDKVEDSELDLTSLPGAESVTSIASLIAKSAQPDILTHSAPPASIRSVNIGEIQPQTGFADGRAPVSEVASQVAAPASIHSQRSEIATNTKVSATTTSKIEEAGPYEASVKVAPDVSVSPAAVPVSTVVESSVVSTPVIRDFADSGSTEQTAAIGASVKLDSAQAPSVERRFVSLAAPLQNKVAVSEINGDVAGVIVGPADASHLKDSVTGDAARSVTSELKKPVEAVASVVTGAQVSTVAAGSVPSPPKTEDASLSSVNHEAVVAAATALVNKGSQRGSFSSPAPAGKERKSAVGEAKPVDSTAAPVTTESARSAALSHATAANLATANPVSGVHQGATGSAAQPAVAEGGNANATISAPLSAVSVPVTMPVSTSGHASSTANADVSLNSVNASAQAHIAGGEHALSPMAHTTLSASPTVLEIGVPGGTQGWLKIRAEIGEGGVVQASLSASTHAGQDALHRGLPALSAFLESEHVPVNLQVTHRVSASADTIGKAGGLELGSGLGQGLSQNANSSAGRGQGEASAGAFAGGSGNGQPSGQQQANSGRALHADTGEASITSDARMTQGSRSTPASYGDGAPMHGGGWLNVIA